MLKAVKRKVYLLIIISLLLVSCVFSGISVFAQTPQNVSVSVTVAPKTTDFQFAFASTDGKTNVAQDEVLSYEITYGAQASAGFSTTTTLVADYSSDLAPSGSHVLDYVPGSAGNAYGGAVPVVDLINRKITWTISALPPGATNQTVAFQLRTNSNFTGESAVNFTTRAQMSNQYVTMPDETVTQAYTHDPALVPTPVPTNTPTPIPTTATNPTPTLPVGVTVIPTTKPAPPIPGFLLKILSIDFTNITPSGATVLIRTLNPVKNAVSYGSTPRALLQRVQGDNYTLSDSVSLVNLKSDTAYFFRVTSTDAQGNTIQSEIYTFRTAKESGAPFEIGEGAVSIDHYGAKVYSKIVNKNTAPGFALMTENTNFTFSYTPKNPVSYKSFDVIIRSKNSHQGTVTNLIRKEGAYYLAQLKTTGAGHYEVFLKAMDEKGNVTEQKIADMKVINHMTILEQGSSMVIGDARIFLYFFNTKTGKFEPVAKDFFGQMQNPSFTDANGRVNIILPSGKYRVDAGAFFYDKTSREFLLGEGDGEEFPRIFLTKNPFNFIGLLQNVKDFVNDSIIRIAEVAMSIAGSVRIFNIAAAGAAITSLFTLIAFLYRVYIDPKKLPLFLLFNLHLAIKKHIGKYIFGTALGKDNQPIEKAIIQLIDAKSGDILVHTTTNKNGRFHLQNRNLKENIKLLIGKDGYKEKEVIIEKTVVAPEGLTVILSVADGKMEGAAPPVLRGVGHIMGSLFETSLVIAIILQLFFLASFGLERTLPFFALSLLNVLLWVLFVRR